MPCFISRRQRVIIRDHILHDCPVFGGVVCPAAIEMFVASIATVAVPADPELVMVTDNDPDVPADVQVAAVRMRLQPLSSSGIGKVSLLLPVEASVAGSTRITVTPLSCFGGDLKLRP